MFCDEITPELRKSMEEFEDRFDDIVPLEMVGGTTEELLRNIQRCFEADKNLLPEIYGWKFDGSVIY